MGLKNTASEYGSIAKWLHWVTAFLFLVSYVSVYYRDWFTEDKTPENIALIHIHFSVGVTVAVLVVLRILWRMSNQSPDLEPGTKLEHMGARLGHFALYAIMIVMPLTGYMGTGANTNFFFLFEIPKFESTALFESLVVNGLGMTNEEFEEPMDVIHKKIMGEWLVWILIVGHALAALYHHRVKKDRTLQKMTFGQS